ncbi:MAG: hypothetical protein ACI9FB_002987 [Candidatus Azotimanducaceae bacterium]|jgi:hypothetical protein
MRAIPVPPRPSSSATARKTTSRSSAVTLRCSASNIPNFLLSVAIFTVDSSDGSICLLRSGKVGGGKLEVGKNSFLEWSNSNRVQVDCEGRTLEYLELANLNDREAGPRIAAFVASVAEFKADAEKSYVKSRS